MAKKISKNQEFVGDNHTRYANYFFSLYLKCMLSISQSHSILYHGIIFLCHVMSCHVLLKFKFTINSIFILNRFLKSIIISFKSINYCF